ncbi:RVP_2 domain-containing protein [Gossypium australe]|uniref:RVP_2 domain-containing protein n=1 Tax=Gossypium australe TaxID=47621 RepID=A0A5B6VLS0_9ROSI|nr:RVP_2 domain-containing protein [Gossypium australe]
MLKSQKGELVSVETNIIDSTTNIISSLSTQKLVRKGCEAYLVYILDTKVSESKVELVLTVRDFTDVFLEEFLRLPLNREVEFAIELAPGSSLISIAPYRMEPVELKNLKLSCKNYQIEDFFD